MRVDVPRAALRGANFVPHLRNVTVTNSFYDGVNFTNVDNLIYVTDSRFYDNRGEKRGGRGRLWGSVEVSGDRREGERDNLIYVTDSRFYEHQAVRRDGVGFRG